MPFTQKTMNGFEMIQRTAAIEISAMHPGHRAFIGVNPPLPQKGIALWLVRRFEIPIESVDKYFGEEDLVDSQLIRLKAIDEVETLLLQWGVNALDFDAPWKCDYPL